MFDIGFWELALIAVIGLIVLGPERLPGAARTLGRWVGRARMYANSLRHELENAAGADELRRDVDSFRRDVDSFRDEVTRGGRQLRSEFEGDEHAQPSPRGRGHQATSASRADPQQPDPPTRRGRRLRAETGSGDTLAPETSRETATEQDDAD